MEVACKEGHPPQAPPSSNSIKPHQGSRFGPLFRELSKGVSKWSICSLKWSSQIKPLISPGCSLQALMLLIPWFPPVKELCRWYRVQFYPHNSPVRRAGPRKEGTGSESSSEHLEVGMKHLGVKRPNCSPPVSSTRRLLNLPVWGEEARGEKRPAHQCLFLSVPSNTGGYLQPKRPRPRLSCKAAPRLRKGRNAFRRTK